MSGTDIERRRRGGPPPSRAAIWALALMLAGCLESEATLRERIRARPRDAAARLALARYYEDRGRVEEAMEAYEATVEAAPDTKAAYLPLARLYARVGYFDAAREYAEIHLYDDPNHLEATLLAARAFLADGDAQMASEYEAKARKLGFTGTLTKLKVEEAYGLIGILRHRERTKHFLVRAGSEGLAREVGRMAESVLEALAPVYGLGEAERPRYRLYVFNDRTQYVGYAKDYHAERADYGGFFCPRSKKIVVYATPETGGRDAWLPGILLHELSHLFMYWAVEGRYGPSYPLWLDEGMAEYHRSGLASPGAFTVSGSTADQRRDAPRVVEAGHWTPMSAFLRLRPIRHRPHYVQAWGLVHWLRTERPEDFRRYLDAVRRHEDGIASFHRIFGAPEAVEAKVRAHLASFR